HRHTAPPGGRAALGADRVARLYVRALHRRSVANASRPLSAQSHGQAYQKMGKTRSALTPSLPEMPPSRDRPMHARIARPPLGSLQVARVTSTARRSLPFAPAKKQRRKPKPPHATSVRAAAMWNA